VSTSQPKKRDRISKEEEAKQALARRAEEEKFNKIIADWQEEREKRQQAEAKLHSIEADNQSAIQAGRDEAKKAIAALQSAKEITNEAGLYVQQADEAAREALKRLTGIQALEDEINISLDNLLQRASKLDAEELPELEYKDRIVQLQKEGQFIGKTIRRARFVEQVIVGYAQQAQQAVQAIQEATIKIDQYIEQAIQAAKQTHSEYEVIREEAARQVILLFAEKAANMTKLEKGRIDFLYNQARMRQQDAQDAATQATELIARILYTVENIQLEIDSYINIDRLWQSQ
jgi:hypothetical protein